MIWLIKTEKDSFTKDLAMLVDVMRGLIYRDFGMKHTSLSIIRKNGRVKNIKRW